MRTVFLTGSTGYIGKALLTRLLSEGYLVKSLVRNVNRIPDFLLSHPGLHILEGHLGELSVLKQGVTNAGVIFHLASSIRMFEKNNELYRTNIKGTENLLNACVEAKQKVRFIFTSSIEAVGPGLERFTGPQDTPQPTTDYGKSKLEGEKIIKRFSQEHPNITYTIVRVGNVYNQDNGVIRAIEDIAKERSWRASLLYRKLNNCSLALIHLEDLVNILLLLIDNQKAENKTYFAVGECVSIEKIISSIEQEHNLRRGAREPILDGILLALWNFGMRRLKRSDLIAYLSVGGKKKFRNYQDENILTDLQFIPQTKFGLTDKEKL